MKRRMTGVALRHHDKAAASFDMRVIFGIISCTQSDAAMTDFVRSYLIASGSFYFDYIPSSSCHSTTGSLSDAANRQQFSGDSIDIAQHLHSLIKDPAAHLDW